MSESNGGGPEQIPVTVVMRSFNDAPILPRTLAALDAQEGVEVALGVIESASGDDSAQIFREHGFAWMKELKPGEYWSSSVLNYGAEKAGTEVVVFLNSDAVLQHSKVLRQLADALLAKPDIAGVFGAQVVRADANVMTRIEYIQAFGKRGSMGEEGNWMSMVCSAVRRSVWEKFPFDERITYAEDAVWSRSVIASGYEIVFVPEAEAEHSHDYNWGERFRRGFGDSSALAVGFGERPPGRIRGVWVPWMKRSLRFGWETVKLGKPWMALYAPVHIWPLVNGSWWGALAGWEHVDDAKTAGEKFDPREQIAKVRWGSR